MLRRLRFLGKNLIQKPLPIYDKDDIIRTIRACVNTKGEQYLSDRMMWSIIYYVKHSKPTE